MLKQYHIKTILMLIFSIFLTAGCATRALEAAEAQGSGGVGPGMTTLPATSTASPSLAQLGYAKIDEFPAASSGVNKIRYQALKETATTLGAQGALAWRAEHVDVALENQGSYLDHIFDFNQLLLKHNVLPPVLVESDGNLTLDGSDTIRMADKTYKIEAPARFVTAPPTWRNYIWMIYNKPDTPDQTLLPVDKAEAKIWNFYLQQGWKDGLQQANEIFAANLSRLKRDYLGMVLYRKLLAQGIISSPIVSKADLGVTGDADQLRINDEIVRITAQSALQPDSSKWNAILTK